MTRAPDRRPHRVAFLATLAVVASAVVAAPASAGTTKGPITFETEVDGCAGGYGTAIQQILVTLKDSRGVTVDSGSTFTESGGYWQWCFDRPVRSGQRLTVSYGDASQERTVTIPRVSASLSRTTNVATGTAAPGVDVMLELWTCTPGDCSIDSQQTITVPATGPKKGQWSRTYTAANPRGGDHLRAYRIFESLAGTDRFYAEAYAPQMTVRATQPWNVGMIANKGDVTIKLLARDGTVRGTISTTFSETAYVLLPFRKHGQKVSTRPGDRVVASLAFDASMKLPASLKVTMDDAGDTTTASCFPNQPYRAEVGSPAFPGVFRGLAAADGTVTIETEIGPGDTAMIACADKAGDILVLRGALPAP